MRNHGTLNSLGLDELCNGSETRRTVRATQLTFNLRNSTQEDVLLSLLILQGSNDLLHNGLGEVGLLALLDLLFVTDPAVEHRLELGSDGNFLLLDKVLGLEFGGFLCGSAGAAEAVTGSYLGQGKEGLGDGNDVLHLADIGNALLDGTSVLRTGIIEDVANARDVTFSPLTVGLAESLKPM